MQTMFNNNHLLLVVLVIALVVVLSSCKRREQVNSDPTKYFLTFEDDSPERKAYAKELVSFVERLQHDETTFDADLSAKLDELRITLLTSPDGKLKIYSWEDGDFGSTMSFHTLYQTRGNSEFHAVFMDDYYREPRKLYQLESPNGPVCLVEYFFRESGWSSDIGVDAFRMDKTGRFPRLHRQRGGQQLPFDSVEERGYVLFRTGTANYPRSL